MPARIARTDIAFDSPRGVALYLRYDAKSCAPESADCRPKTALQTWGGGAAQNLDKPADKRPYCRRPIALPRGTVMGLFLCPDARKGICLPGAAKQHQMPFDVSARSKNCLQIAFELFPQAEKRHQISFGLSARHKKCHQIVFDVSSPSERRFQAAFGRSVRLWRGNHDTVTGRRGMRRRIIQIKEGIL